MGIKDDSYFMACASTDQDKTVKIEFEFVFPQATLQILFFKTYFRFPITDGDAPN